MADATTMKLSTRNRDELRRLADADGLTLDQQLEVLLRRERKRRLGEQLSSGWASSDTELAKASAVLAGRVLSRTEPGAVRGKRASR